LLSYICLNFAKPIQKFKDTKRFKYQSLIFRTKMENLNTLRHSASHILAHAVKDLFPNAKLGIGPAIENGFYYDFNVDKPFTPEDLEKIEKRMKEIIAEDQKFERFELTYEEAKKLMKNEPYKLELIEELHKKGKPLIFYQNGRFTDLCAGPHVESTGHVKAVKLLKTSGAYWKGKSDNPQLQRIYGTAFPTEGELKEYLHRIEEAEKRDHRKLGKQLNLFSFHEEGPGFVFWHPKGMVLRNLLINYWKEEHAKENYDEVNTPILLNKNLWVRSGHWENYRENMYTTMIDNEEYAIKPMNCPGGILIYNSRVRSYRDFPWRVAELGLVHRHELSGVLSGLTRVRQFTQDDAHIYMTEDQIKDEIIKVIKLIGRMYRMFGFEYSVELSTRPEKSIGTDKQWEKATAGLQGALDELGIDYKINEGDGAFYGPKIDFHLKDAIGRTFQCGTIQLDMNLPERFDMLYDGSDGKKHRPVMIHRTVFGSIERFIGILIEHYAGKFPLWLNPVQIKILSMNEECIEYAEEVKKELVQNGFRVEIDSRAETMSKKVRDAQLEKVNYMVTVGNKEKEAKTLAIRNKEGKVSFGVKVGDFIKQLKEEVESKK